MKTPTILSLQEHLQKLTDSLWDAIIVGSGVGGATTAHALASRGLKVLVIEMGGFPHPQAKLPLWSQNIFDSQSKKSFRPFVGEGVGGSSSLYGMVMERPEASDFSNSGGAWPGSYTDWAPYFDRVEKLFHVQESSLNPLFNPLHNLLMAHHLHVKQLNLACRDVKQCDFCQSRICDKKCKVDAASGPLQAALQTGHCFLLPNTQVTNIFVRGFDDWKISVQSGESRVSLKAKHLVLAAGALRTPILLQSILDSAHLSPLKDSTSIGRYLMRHLIDLYSLSWPEMKTLSKDQRRELSISKTWCFDDYYSFQGLKLGTVQAFGRVPDFEYIWEEVSSTMPWLKVLPFGQMIVKKASEKLFSYPMAASIVEDSPSKDNFISQNNNGPIIINYNILQEDQVKLKLLREKLKSVFGSNLVKFIPEAHNNMRLAHACGTCRMGDDPRTSVVDYQGRVHGFEQLWIADASIFPSSLGKNPSLTIAAHSLRMAEHLVR